MAEMPVSGKTMNRNTQKLAYEVGNAGWALLRFDDGNQELVFAVSYLHDSLADLAHAALHLHKGGHSVNAVFMDEPGEVHLFAEGQGDRLHYELRRYSDWASWGTVAMDDHEVVAQGDIQRHDLIFNIHQVLDGIYKNIGVKGYLERWGEHDFPLEAYRRLAGLINKKKRS